MLIFCIQYDKPDGNHVFTKIYEAKDAREALAEFDKHYTDYRVLSIELIPQSKANDFQYRMNAETQMRNRVIECLK
jgi:hypothetical protein